MTNVKTKNITEIHQGWNKLQAALRILVKVFESQIVTLNFDLMTQQVNRDVNSQSENDNARLLKWVKPEEALNSAKVFCF